ncbi:MAG: hypothetical protein QNJ44_23225 [Rhodobacter sp.]|nr:hypothetical protein [Rhodobacter sp.]
MNQIHNLDHYDRRARELRAEATRRAFAALGDWLRKRLGRQPQAPGQTA